MKKYTKVYFDFFGIGLQDWIPCEMCGCTAVDIHHIQARSKRKDLENEITNLMALCRRCHEVYGDRKEHLETLQATHNLRVCKK